MSLAPFYRLPTELRFKIYHYYFAQEDGYHYNHDSGQLTLADGSAIDLDLMSVSQPIANETRHLPFLLNTVHFSTGCPERIRLYAWCIYFLMDDRSHYYELAFRLLGRFITPEVYNTVARQYPSFTRIMDQMIAHPHIEGQFDSDFIWISGGVPSVCHSASDLLLRTILSAHDESEIAEAIYEAWGLYRLSAYPKNPFKCLLVDYELWDIPSKTMAQTLADAFRKISRFRGHVPNLRFASDGRDRSDQRGQKFRYSAAAAAIDFLNRMPIHVRRQLKNLMLVEDQPSNSAPSGHARGLIPFCLENPLLHIERRVSLFGNLLQKDWPGSISRPRPDYIPEEIGIWLVEAWALAHLGMPQGSFSLIIDGQPAPEQAGEIFQNIVLRAAALQIAFDEARSRDILTQPRTFLGRVSHPCFVFEDFPKAIELLYSDNPLISCNFNPGELWDIEQLLTDRQGWDWVEWGADWFRVPPTDYNPREDSYMPCDTFTQNKTSYRATHQHQRFERGLPPDPRIAGGQIE